MKKELMKAAKYREEYFHESSRPAVSTIRRWINNGDLPGTVIGNVYYVDISLTEKMTGNDLADKVLMAS